MYVYIYIYTHLLKSEVRVSTQLDGATLFLILSRPVLSEVLGLEHYLRGAKEKEPLKEGAL